MAGGVSKGVGTQTVSTLLADFRMQKFASFFYFLFQLRWLVRPNAGLESNLISMALDLILKFYVFEMPDAKLSAKTLQVGCSKVPSVRTKLPTASHPNVPRVGIHTTPHKLGFPLLARPKRAKPSRLHRYCSCAGKLHRRG